jgi:hypothetical protein
LNAAPDQRLHRRRTGADVNQLGIQTVSLECADLLRHPDRRHAGTDRSIRKRDFFFGGFRRFRGDKKEQDPTENNFDAADRRLEFVSSPSTGEDKGGGANS